jgi:hypothetical protein
VLRCPQIPNDKEEIIRGDSSAPIFDRGFEMEMGKNIRSEMDPRNRVTRWVCEKIAQNVAQSIIWQIST